MTKTIRYVGAGFNSDTTGRLTRGDTVDLANEQADRFVAEMDLVRRDEFDVLKDEIAALRAPGGLGLVARSLGQAHGARGQLGELVEDRIARLHDEISRLGHTSIWLMAS